MGTLLQLLQDVVVAGHLALVDLIPVTGVHIDEPPLRELDAVLSAHQLHADLQLRDVPTPRQLLHVCARVDSL